MRELTVQDALNADESAYEFEVYMMMLAFDVADYEVEDWDVPTFYEKFGQVMAVTGSVDGTAPSDMRWVLSDGREVPFREVKGMDIHRANKLYVGQANQDVHVVSAVTGMLPETIAKLPLGDFLTMRVYLSPLVFGGMPPPSETPSASLPNGDTP